MGWDVTYHPVGSAEMTSLYFDTLADPSKEDELAQRYSLDTFYANKMQKVFAGAREFPPDMPFNKGHAFYAAIVLGFVRKFHYVRGGAFSFLADDPTMRRYIGDWKDLVPPQERHLTFENQLTENYCGGVYLPHAQLRQMRADYTADAAVRDKLDTAFSHGRLAVFWRAVDSALNQSMGLVEAAEVVEPNPRDLKASSGFSNVLNCESDGLLLYADAARKQLAQAQKQFTQADRARKGLFARLLGK
jgi:hypothetical protein